MDIRKEGWFGQLVLSGVTQTQAHRGSIMAIIAEILKDLHTSRPRADNEGEAEILIRIRNKAFDTSRDSSQQLGKALEVESMLIDGIELDKPFEGEQYAEFYDRLIKQDYQAAAALLIAAEWFERDADSLTVQWLNDPKAARFRELNTRHEAFEAAMPQEYESLKSYVKEQYPTIVEHMTFRTA